MSRRLAKFTSAEIRRAVRVANEVGKIVELCPDGTIRIRDAAPVANSQDAQNDAEKWPDDVVL